VIAGNTDDMTVDQYRQLLRNGSGIRVSAEIFDTKQLLHYATLSHEFGVIMLISNSTSLTTHQCKLIAKRSPGKVIIEL